MQFFLNSIEPVNANSSENYTCVSKGKAYKRRYFLKLVRHPVRSTDGIAQEVYNYSNLNEKLSDLERSTEGIIDGFPRVSVKKPWRWAKLSCSAPPASFNLPVDVLDYMHVYVKPDSAARCVGCKKDETSSSSTNGIGMSFMHKTDLEPEAGFDLGCGCFNAEDISFPSDWEKTRDNALPGGGWPPADVTKFYDEWVYETRGTWTWTAGHTKAPWAGPDGGGGYSPPLGGPLNEIAPEWQNHEHRKGIVGGGTRPCIVQFLYKVIRFEENFKSKWRKEHTCSKEEYDNKSEKSIKGSELSLSQSPGAVFPGGEKFSTREFEGEFVSLSWGRGGKTFDKMKQVYKKNTPSKIGLFYKGRRSFGASGPLPGRGMPGWSTERYEESRQKNRFPWPP